SPAAGAIPALTSGNAGRLHLRPRESEHLRFGRWSRSQGAFRAFVKPDMQEHGQTDAIGDAEPSRAAEESISLLPADFDPGTAMRPFTTAAATASGGRRRSRIGMAIYRTTKEQRINATRLGAVGYTFTRSPDAADRWMAAMTSWRRTASAKSGTVRVPSSMS